MKKTLLKHIIGAASISAVAGYANMASAHTQTGSLGTEAGATDVYLVTCATGDDTTGRLELSVINVTASSPLLSAHLEKDGVSFTGTDPVSGDGNFSPLISLTGGDGGYNLTIDKAGAGAANYSIDFHCKTGSGVHTGEDTSIVLLQNDTNIPSPPVDVEFDPTEVKDEAIEAATLYTGFTVNQGCQDDVKSAAPLPVVALSSVFPNATDSNAFQINADGTETPINLADYIEGANGGVINLAPGMIQDKNIFKKQREITDANGNVRGIEVKTGKLDVAAVGIIPFRVSAPAFKAETCAKKLNIRIAVANYCNKTKNTSKDNRSDIWIGHPTPLFSDSGVLPHDFAATPYWPTLIVNRNLVDNPLGINCGDGFDIAVQPSDADIDKFIPVDGFWPK